MSSSFRSFYRYFAVIISLCLIISLVGPNIAKAAPGETKRTPKQETLAANVGELPNKLPKEKLELTSKRTPFSTRFLNPDGSFTEEIFLDQQFYQDPSDKKWKKIDNNLKVSKKKLGKFENTSNDVNTLFAQQSSNGELVTVEKGGKSVSFLPLKANKVQGIIKDNEVTFKGILKDVDFRYSVQGSAVKEDIILHQYQNQNTFTFELKVKGVTPYKEKNGTIVFKDSKGKTAWFFENPYMTDAKGNYSEKVSLELREENGKVYVDVLADKGFLENPETEYPVTIDPTIDSWNVLRDNFVASSFPDSTFSSNTYMHTGYNSYFGTTRALLRFYLPSLPSDSVIDSATFNAYQTRNDGQLVSVDLHRITSDWPSSITWNTQPATVSTKESTVTSSSYNDYWSWDITKLAKDWYNGVQANYGLTLKQQNETTSPYRTFTSVNNGNNTPRLSVNYRVEAIGLESFWTNTKDGINPANGNLVYQETDLQIPGRGPEVSLTRTYNSRKSSFKGLFGFGWMSNLDQWLVDSGSGPITLIDKDNTRHIFGEKVGGGYEAAGGVYLDLVKNADGTYVITEIDGTETNFNTSGKISSIVDTNGNTTTFVYDTGKLIKVQDASGRATSFAYGTNGYVTSVTDPAGRVTGYVYDTAGNLTKVTDPEGKISTFSYDIDHNLTGITDARSIKTTVGYDTSDRVTSISRPLTINGAMQTSQTAYAYDTINLVTSVTDGEGKRVDYTVNANGNVVQTTGNPLDSANKTVTTFTYDSKNNLTKVVEPNINKVNGTSAYVYTYDDKGNITGVQLPENQNSTFGYDSNNNLIREQDFNNNVSTNDYDKNNNQIEATDPNVQTSASRYDANGNLLYSTHPMSAADNLLDNSGFELDQNKDNWPDGWTKMMQPNTTANYGWSNTSKFGNRSISISNPSGWAIVSSEKVKYEAGDQFIASAYIKTENTANTALIKIEYLNAQGTPLQPTSYSFGLKGSQDWTRVQAVVSDVPDQTDTILVSFGLNAGAGTAYFDGVQLEKGSTLAAYNLVENSSFEHADSTTAVLPANWSASSNFSANDKLVQNVSTGDDNVYIGKSSFQLTGEVAKNKHLKQTVNLSGDANTKLTLSGWSKQIGVNPNGGSYEMQVVVNYTDGTKGYNFGNEFDKNIQDWQHVAAFVKPAKAFSSLDVYYHYNNQAGTAWFDAARLEIGTSITSNTYDAGGNYVTSVKDQLGNTVSIEYDTVGNQTSFTDAKGQKTSFAYDGRNLLTKVTDTKLGVTSYGYDSTGNRTTVTDAKGNLTKYDYNELNLVSKFTNPLNQVTQLEYDRNGNQTKLVYPKGDTISTAFDAHNLLSSMFVNGVKKWDFGYDANGNLTSVTDASGNGKTYTYDNNNHLIQEAKGSIKLDYGYDPNSNLNSLKITAGTNSSSTEFAFNKLNQLISLSKNGSNRAKFVYDERANVISVKRANTSYTSLQYDDANRLNELKNYKNDGTVLNSYKYSYDSNSNQTSIVTDKGTVSYEYDALNQLAKETLTDGTEIVYEYDKVGNRTKKIETKGTSTVTTAYTYNVGNELTNVNGQAYVYDLNGNLISDGDKTYIYNEENQLIEIKDMAGTSLGKFTYDHEGKRNSMTTSAGTINFHYNGNKVIAETDTNGVIIAEYTWDTQGNPVTMVKDGRTFYYHINGHGDVTALTDENGNVAAQYEYDAWGKIISQTGTMAAANPYRYAGYRYDESTKLYYLMFRYYNPRLGRFFTRDSILYGNDGQPLTQNLYAYASNNPVSYTDPTGHGIKTKILKFALREAADMLRSKFFKERVIRFVEQQVGKRMANVLRTHSSKIANQLDYIATWDNIAKNSIKQHLEGYLFHSLKLSRSTSSKVATGIAEFIMTLL